MSPSLQHHSITAPLTHVLGVPEEPPVHPHVLHVLRIGLREHILAVVDIRLEFYIAAHPLYILAGREILSVAVVAVIVRNLRRVLIKWILY